MSVRESRRAAALERMADHLLREGLAGASLRPLAAAAGISDRMLLYYFADKDEVLTETLRLVAMRLGALLDAAGAGAAPRPFDVLLMEVWTTLRAPALAPYMRLWFELAAAAARGQQPHRAVAGAIADGFLAWTAARLEATDDSAREATAALLLATVDGLALLDAVGRGQTADRAVTAPRPGASH